ncbi:hypothetical protein F4677DRAFT_457624 [Hypoxylon crocopeplum]|nr:hypothetical protein F4677DRAFT_457624 [Hypoxylon crocopeplum]
MASESEDDYDSDLDQVFGDRNGNYAETEGNFEERFEAVSQAIKKKERFIKGNDIDDFFAAYRDIVGKYSSKCAKNLLHVLVEVVKHNDDIKPEDFELLIRRLVEKYPALLVYKNKDEHNPIFMAIRDSLHQLKGKTCLYVALEEDFDLNTTIMLIKNASDGVLAVQDDLGRTPMHYAVSSGKFRKTKVQLIDLFIERDLSAIQRNPQPCKTFLDLADKKGLSIYSAHKRTRAQVMEGLDEAVARQHPAAEDTKRDQNDVSRSTEGPILIVPRPQAGTGDPRHVGSVKPTDDRDRERFDSDGRAGGGLDEREKLRQQKKAEEAAAKPKGAESLGKTGRPEERDLWSRDESQSRPTFSEPDENAAQLAVRNSNATRQQEPAPNTTDYAKAKIQWAKNSDKILLSLKLHYMRTRNAEMVILFLYGTNMDDVQISFDYDDLPRKMLWNEFIERFGADTKSGLKFDNVLQYVTFPHVEVRLKGRLADRKRDTAPVRQPGDLGREDMKYFFDWLYKKGVRRIIKLTVEDSGDSSEKVHSDQAIQESTERFIIEQLDWQKMDLDPETILHVSSKVTEKEAPTSEKPANTELVPDRQLKQLSLRWSGKGLPMLPQLQRIYVFKPSSDKEVKMYDNPQWINEKIDQFRIRLNANRKAAQVLELTTSRNQAPSDVSVALGDVEVISSNTDTYENRKVTSHDTPHSTTQVSAKSVDSHRWLDSTLKFAGEMIPFWQNTVQDFLKSRHNQGTTERVEDDVVLALIDDGVDRFDKSLTNQVIEGKSFDFHNGRLRPPFSSARGHGTVMASMILRVCPMAKVYPIRLKTYDKPDGKCEIDRDYAAQAIQAALDKNATIISMSWTLPMAKDKNHSEDRLHAVLKDAVDKNVLMFCCAPDKGKFNESDYPSGPWRDRFFRIGAAHADGSIFSWTPEDGITYVLPGVDVPKDQVGRSSSFETPLVMGSSTRVTDFKYETGSSVATALAAGLAAMIIYCVKASILAVKTANQNKGPVVGIAIPDNGANLIADPDAMKRAFASLGTVTSNHFVQVWEELDEVSATLETLRVQSSNPEVKRNCIDSFVQFGHKLANSIKP